MWPTQLMNLFNPIMTPWGRDCHHRHSFVYEGSLAHRLLKIIQGFSVSKWKEAEFELECLILETGNWDYGIDPVNSILLMSASNKEKERVGLTYSFGTIRYFICLFFHSLSDSSQLTVLVLQGSPMANGMLSVGKTTQCPCLKMPEEWWVMSKL